MSKVDAQRAMKSARHARAATGAAVPAPSVAPGPGRRPAEVSAVTPPAAAPAAEPGACGHRNMGGKACRRPGGHPEKSHRYT